MYPEATEKQTLIRGLGLIAAISVIIAWIAAGLLSLAGALTYAELTAMKPQAAGPYVFLRDSYGRLSSFLFGWMQESTLGQTVEDRCTEFVVVDTGTQEVLAPFWI